MTPIAKAILASAGALLLCGCGADPNYESPEKTVATYLENGPKLANSIDIPAWNFSWYALSKSSQKWFEENWEAICERPDYRAACGDQTNPAKQRMVAFGAAIADRGPGKYATIKEVKVEGKSAQVTFEGWGGTMYLIKEGRNWRIDGLFGVEELASNQW